MLLKETDRVDSISKRLDTYFENHFNTGFFDGYRGVKIRFAVPKKQTSGNALVVLGGRNEFIERYIETFCDLGSLDLAIYSYDHRGQGGSERLLTDPHKGHVQRFSDYVEDLRIFLERMVGKSHEAVYILAHSMGANIAAQFLGKHHHTVKGAVLLSPMFGIKLSPLPQAAAQIIAGCAVKLGLGESYVFGGKPYRGKERFADNPLTSSRQRFDLTYKMIEAKEKLALGSPTFNWLHEALEACIEVERIAAGIKKLPVLIVQGGQDRVVINDSHRRFCASCEECTIKTIKEGRHELHMERDELRLELIAHITEFLSQFGIQKIRFPHQSKKN